MVKKFFQSNSSLRIINYDKSLKDLTDEHEGSSTRDQHMQESKPINKMHEKHARKMEVSLIIVVDFCTILEDV